LGAGSEAACKNKMTLLFKGASRLRNIVYHLKEASAQNSAQIRPTVANIYGSRTLSTEVEKQYKRIG